MRVVVIGGGYWGQNYIRELGHRCVGVVESDKVRAKAVRDKFGIKVFPGPYPPWHTFDAAVIATPPQSHVELALPLLHGGKYVLIEKPLATNVESATALAGYEDRCMVGHLYRFHPGVAALKDYADNHAIDHVFCRRTNNGPVRTWQDAMWDLAPHDVSILLYLFGAPIAVASTGTRDWSMLHFTFPNTHAVIYCSWLGGPKVRTIELVPSDGRDRYVFDDMAVTLTVSPLRRMLDAFLSGGPWDRCTVSEGIDVVRVLQSAV